VKDPEPSAHWALIKGYSLPPNPAYKHDETPATALTISLLFFIPTASIHGWQPADLRNRYLNQTNLSQLSWGGGNNIFQRETFDI
jgi:hypothetical protein